MQVFVDELYKTILGFHCTFAGASGNEQRTVGKGEIELVVDHQKMDLHAVSSNSLQGMLCFPAFCSFLKTGNIPDRVG